MGADDIGERVRRQLASDRIDTQPIEAIADSTTGVALIFRQRRRRERDRHRCRRQRRSDAGLPARYQQKVIDADALLMQLESPLETVIAAARLAKQYHTQVILNPAPARELPDELLGMIDMITPNETEAQRLTGIAVDNDADARAAQALHDKGIATVIITLGSRGVWLSETATANWCPASRCKRWIPSPPAIPLTVRWSPPCWKARSWPTRCVSPMRRRLSP